MKTRLLIMLEIDEDPEILKGLVMRSDPLIKAVKDVNAQDVLSFITNDEFGHEVKVENGSSKIEGYE